VASRGPALETTDRDGPKSPSLRRHSLADPSDGSAGSPRVRRLFYTDFDEAHPVSMKRILVNAALLAVLLSFSLLQAAEKQYAPGRIITVEKKFHTRVLYYLVNTPVTQDDPYYELSLQLGNTVLLTEYTPRHAADELPDGWQDEVEVQMKITDKHHVMVKQPGGMELQLLIVKRMPGTAPSAAPKPAAVQN
jgi:hypothetical protein